VSPPRSSLGTSSLEGVFARVTHQEDYSILAQQILQVARS
jgi:hypothetical protein